jgi:hypothetical protein
MKGYGINPWLVEDLDEFYFLCCPECTYKSKDDEAFMDHAVENHPKSKASSVFSEAEQKLSKQKTVQNLPKTLKFIPKTIKVLPKTVKVIPKTENTSSIDNAEECAYKSKNNKTSIAVENIPKSNLKSSVKRVDKKVENLPKSKAFIEREELCNKKTVSNVEDSMLDESVEKTIAQKLKEINKLKAILQGDAELDDETLKNLKNAATIVIPEAEKTKENQLDEKISDSFVAVEPIKYDYIDGKLIRKKTCEKSNQKTVKVATIDMPKEEKTEENQLIGMDDLNDEYTLDAYIVGKLIFWQNY